MYALLIFIHAVFIGISHILGYQIFEALFFLFCVFFLFYFSPLFFLDNEEKGKKGFSPRTFFEQFSPKKSMILPTLLLYISIYGFTYALFRTDGSILYFHAGITITLFILFFIYSLIFYWKNDVFFELLRFHTLFTVLTTIGITLTLFIQGQAVHMLHVIIGGIGIISATFLLSYSRQESSIFLWSYLAGISATAVLLGIWLFPAASIVQVSSVIIIISLLVFEFFPKISVYVPYSTIIRYFSLSIILIFLLPIAWYAWIEVDFTAIIILIITAFFFLLIHRRYTNFIVYMIAIFEVFFVYALVFVDLLHSGNLTSVSLFTFFLPFLVILSTFFWEESHIYDFLLLHYSSIAFSIMYSVYSVFFLPWGGDILFVISLCTLGVALLFFLSYFRFRPLKKTLIH